MGNAETPVILMGGGAVTPGKAEAADVVVAGNKFFIVLLVAMSHLLSNRAQALFAIVFLFSFWASPCGAQGLGGPVEDLASRVEDRFDLATINQIVEEIAESIGTYRCKFHVTNLFRDQTWEYTIVSDGERFSGHRKMIAGLIYDLAPGDILVKSPEINQRQRPEDRFTFDGEKYRYLNLISSKMVETHDLGKIEEYVHGYWLMNPISNPWVALFNYPCASGVSFSADDGYGVCARDLSQSLLTIKPAKSGFQLFYDGKKRGDVVVEERGGILTPVQFELVYGSVPGGVKWNASGAIEAKGGEVDVLSIPQRIECIHNTGQEGLKSMNSHFIEVKEFELVDTPIDAALFSIPETAATEITDLDVSGD